MNGDESIVKEVLEYLNKNCEEGKTFMDIAEYWIKIQKVDELVEKVKEAVEFLLDEKLIVCDESSYGPTIYKTNEDVGRITH